jgi:hypothetical protein
VQVLHRVRGLDRFGYAEFIRGLLNSHVAEPDDPPAAVIDLGPIVIMIVIVLGEMSMDDNVRMMRIRFMDMLGRDGG